jgi:protein-S-isoprenylcysteine O-methyltransferase Ste14
VNIRTLREKATKYRLLGLKIGTVGFIVLSALSQSGWEKQLPTFASALFFLGVILATVGFVGRLWCSIYIAGYKNESLINLGPYSIVRHPLYLFSLIGIIGVGFCTETLLMPLVLAGFALIWYILTIQTEEKFLQEKHGELFEKYRLAVPRLIPSMQSIKSIKAPDEYNVMVKIWAKHLINNSVVFGLIGLLELIEGLHDQGLLPTLFVIY